MSSLPSSSRHAFGKSRCPKYLKFNLLFSLFVTLFCAAQSDLRIVGTNLIDFSYAAGKNRHSPYLISGRVLAVYPKAVDIGSPTGTVYVSSPDAMGGAVNYGDPNDLLHMAAAARMSHNPSGDSKPLSPGAYMALSPEMKSYFVPQSVYEHHYVLHCAHFQVGQEVSVLALQLSNGTFDCGTPFVGSTSGRPMLRLYPDHIEKIGATNSPYSSEVAAKPSTNSSVLSRTVAQH